MKNNLLLIILILIIFPFSLKAQMGINTNSPDSCAVLDIVSPKQDKGLLIPRVSDLNNIEKPANSLMVFNTTDSSFYFYRYDKWHEITPLLKEFGHDTIFTKENTSILLPKGNISLEEGNINLANGNVYIAAGNLSLTDGNVDITGNLNSSATVSAKTFSGNGIIPIGGIIMWSGSSVPDDSWVLCNGGLVTDPESPIVNKPIPDLSGRFIVGAGEEDVNSVGGNTNTVLTEQNMPTHSHNISLMTTETGGHKHGYTLSSGASNQEDHLIENSGDNMKGSVSGYTETYTDVNTPHTKGVKVSN